MNKRYGFIQFQNLIYRHEMYEKIFSLKNEEKYLIAEYYFLFNRIKSKAKALLIINDKNLNNQIINIFKFLLKNYNVSKLNEKSINNFINSISLS